MKYTMSLKDSLKAEAQEERKKLKEMSFRDKIWYIWEYYKIHMLIGAIILFLLYAGGVIIYQKTFTTQLNTIIINDTGTLSDYEELTNRFKGHMNYGKKDLVAFDNSIYLSFDGATSEMGYASLAKVTAIVASRDLDLMICDQDSIDHYASNGGYMDLEEVLPEDLWELVKDDAYYTADEDGSVHPFAIDLKNSHFTEWTNCGLDPAYLGLVSNSKRTETAIEFLRFLYEGE